MSPYDMKLYKTRKSCNLSKIGKFNLSFTDLYLFSDEQFLKENFFTLGLLDSLGTKRV